jgi:hypothetical protein
VSKDLVTCVCASVQKMQCSEGLNGRGERMLTAIGKGPAFPFLAKSERRNLDQGDDASNRGRGDTEENK